VFECVEQLHSVSLPPGRLWGQMVCSARAPCTV
jgi:hypothetical protein